MKKNGFRWFSAVGFAALLLIGTVSAVAVTLLTPEPASARILDKTCGSNDIYMRVNAERIGNNGVLIKNVDVHFRSSNNRFNQVTVAEGGFLFWDTVYRKRDLPGWGVFNRVQVNEILAGGGRVVASGTGFPLGFQPSCTMYVRPFMLNP